MCDLKLRLVFVVFSVALSSLDATQVERLLSLTADHSDGTSDRQGWMLPILSRNALLGVREAPPEQDATRAKSHHLEKRKCSVATCMTNRLANLLANSVASKNRSPTDVGSSTFGKRARAGPLSRDGLHQLAL